MTPFLILAAIVFGPEITSVPYTPTLPQTDCAAATLSAADGATFLAWPLIDSGRAGISTVLLDRNFHVIAGKSVFLDRPTQPACLASATDGETIVLVWTRPLTAETSAVEAARFNRRLELIEGPLTLNPSAPQVSRPAIAWNANAGIYLIAAGQRRMELAANTSLASARAYELESWKNVALSTKSWLAYDSVASGGASFVLTARALYEVGPGWCNPRIACPSPQPPVATVAVARPQWLPMTELRSGSVDPGTTAASCIRTDCLVVWNDGGAAGLWIDSGRRLHLGFAGAALAAAADDERVVVVGDESRAVIATIVTPASRSENMIVAIGTEVRRRPAILKLAEGRFLVAYEIVDSAVSSRLGGRVIELDPPARRRITR